MCLSLTSNNFSGVKMDFRFHKKSEKLALMLYVSQNLTSMPDTFTVSLTSMIKRVLIQTDERNISLKHFSKKHTDN